MYTDWLLIRRLAWELNRRFTNARVKDVGQLPDGRFALEVWAQGSSSLICVDAFAATPVVTVEDGELPIAVEPGFVRTAGAALRGMTLRAVQSRKNDRLLRFTFGTRSRFGVDDEYALVCELVPRFGNIVLLKGQTIVAAAKEFERGENQVRAVETGFAYEPPPLRPGNSTPLLDEATAQALAENECGADLYAYRNDGNLVQAHLAPLDKYADLAMERAPSLLELLAEGRASHAARAQSDTSEKRRRELARTLGKREQKLRAELALVHAKLERSAQREDLRKQGDAIYATLHELDERERDEAKERAADLFAKYKKAAASVEHLERRRADLEQQLQDVETLQWELERASDEHLADIADAVTPAKPAVRKSPTTARKRKPLQVQTAAGSRILVGRTPIENADLTFRVARPDDLWFHVKDQPGAHVILQRDDKTAPPHDDILTAAALAAFHSKAKNSPKVTVEYTQRKHVRKRPAAAPGLVFYTHPKAVLITPAGPAQ